MESADINGRLIYIPERPVQDVLTVQDRRS